MESSNPQRPSSTNIEGEVLKPVRTLPPKLRVCGNCEHFEPEGAAGYCCYNPPTAHFVMIGNPKHILNPQEPPVMPALQGVFPPTRRDRRRCGKWEIATQGAA